MSGPKRNPDKLNTIGVVVIGICAAVLVYVTIVALQAFYVDDTSEIQTMADYGGQDTQARQIRQDQTGTLTAQSVPNPAPTKVGEIQTFHIPVKYAIKYVVDAAKVDPSKLVPMHGKSCKTTVLAPGKNALVDCEHPGAPPPPPPASPPATEPGTGSGSAGQVTPTGGMGPATDKAGSPAEPKKDAPKKDAPKKDAPKKDAPKKDAPKADAPKQDPAKGNAP